MDEVLEFILKNWFLLLSALISLVSLIVIILKKNKSKDTTLLSVIAKLPEWIIEAESVYRNVSNAGYHKYAFVLSKAVRELVALTGLSETEVFNRYAKYLDQRIEEILAAPQKKEK